MARIFLKVGFSTKGTTLKGWPRIDFALWESILRHQSALWKWTPENCDILEFLVQGTNTSWSSCGTAKGFICCQLWLQFPSHSPKIHECRYTDTHKLSLWKVNVALDGLLEFGSWLEHEVNIASGGLSICGPTALRRLDADLLGGGLLAVLCGC